MTLSTELNVKKFLNTIELPGIARTIGDVGRVLEFDDADGRIRAHVELGFAAAGAHESYRQAIISALAAQSDCNDVEIEFSTRIVAHGVQHNLKPLPQIRNVIAVASGKGGVGKSTVAVNLALALAADGAKVGLLDADIYGPSQPHMLGVAGEQPSSIDGKTMQPLQAHGIQVMSIKEALNIVLHNGALGNSGALCARSVYIDAISEGENILEALVLQSVRVDINEPFAVGQSAVNELLVRL